MPSYIYTHTTLLTSPSHSQRQRSSSNAAAGDPPPQAADPASPTGQAVAGIAPGARSAAPAPAAEAEVAAASAVAPLDPEARALV